MIRFPRFSQLTHVDRFYFFLANVVFYFSYHLMFGFLVLYLTANGYSALYCGMVNTVINLINMLMQPLIGYITDTYISVKKYLVLSSVVLVGMTFLLPAAVQDPVLCFGAVVILSLFAMPYLFLLDSWVVGAKAERPYIDYGQVRAGGSIGAGTASLVFGYVIAQTGFSAMFVAEAIGFAIMLALLRILPGLPLKNRGSSHEKGEEDKSGEPAAEKIPFSTAVKVLATSKSYLFVVFVVLLYHISNKPVSTFLSIFVEARGGNSLQFGIAVGIGAVLEGMVMIFVGRMLRRYKIETLFLISLGLNLLRIVMIMVWDDVVGLVFSQMIQASCYAIGYVSIVEYFNRVSPAHIHGTAMTFGLAFTGGFSALIANVVGGLLCDTVGTMGVGWFSLACGVASMAIYGVHWLKLCAGKK